MDNLNQWRVVSVDIQHILAERFDTAEAAESAANQARATYGGLWFHTPQSTIEPTSATRHITEATVLA